MANIVEHIIALEKKVDHFFNATLLQRKKEELLGDWIPEQELIEVTGISRNTLYKLRQEGKITRSTITGKQNYYRKSDFKKLLDKNEGN